MRKLLLWSCCRCLCFASACLALHLENYQKGSPLTHSLNFWKTDYHWSLCCAVIQTWICLSLHFCVQLCSCRLTKHRLSLPNLCLKVWPKYLQSFCCLPLCWAQSAIFQPVLGESEELKVPPGENCWTWGVRPFPYIALLMRTCLTLADQYFRKLLLVSLPISQDDKDVIILCVYVGV